MAIKKSLVLGSSGFPEEKQAADTIIDVSQDVITMTSGEILATNDAVYIDAANSVKKANAAAMGTMPVIGFVVSGVAISTPVQVQVDGPFVGMSGLTAGVPYFPSASTPGAITATPPSGAGKVVQPIGYALNTTDLLIKIGTPIKLG